MRDEVTGALVDHQTAWVDEPVEFLIEYSLAWSDQLPVINTNRVSRFAMDEPSQREGPVNAYDSMCKSRKWDGAQQLSSSNRQHEMREWVAGLQCKRGHKFVRASVQLPAIMVHPREIDTERSLPW